MSKKSVRDRANDRIFTWKVVNKEDLAKIKISITRRGIENPAKPGPLRRIFDPKQDSLVIHKRNNSNSDFQNLFDRRDVIVNHADLIEENDSTQRDNRRKRKSVSYSSLSSSDSPSQNRERTLEESIKTVFEKDNHPDCCREYFENDPYLQDFPEDVPSKHSHKTTSDKSKSQHDYNKKYSEYHPSSSNRSHPPRSRSSSPKERDRQYTRHRADKSPEYNYIRRKPHTRSPSPARKPPSKQPREKERSSSSSYTRYPSSSLEKYQRKPTPATTIDSISDKEYQTMYEYRKPSSSKVRSRSPISRRRSPRVGGEKSPVSRRRSPRVGGEKSPVSRRRSPRIGGEQSPVSRKRSHRVGDEKSPSRHRSRQSPPVKTSRTSRKSPTTDECSSSRRRRPGEFRRQDAEQLRDVSRSRDEGRPRDGRRSPSSPVSLRSARHWGIESDETSDRDHMRSSDRLREPHFPGYLPEMFYRGPAGYPGFPQQPIGFPPRFRHVGAPGFPHGNVMPLVQFVPVPMAQQPPRFWQPPRPPLIYNHRSMPKVNMTVGTVVTAAATTTTPSTPTTVNVSTVCDTLVSPPTTATATATTQSTAVLQDCQPSTSKDCHS